MYKIHFSSNWNGKLCNDVFTTIRLYNYDKYPDFEKFTIEYKSHILGIAELLVKKPFKFGSLNATTSLVDCGHDEHYLGKLLRNFYPGIDANTNFYMLVLRWETRYKEATELIFKERFEKIESGWMEAHSDLQTQLNFE
jgi:hypothetical protein